MQQSVMFQLEDKGKDKFDHGGMFFHSGGYEDGLAICLDTLTALQTQYRGEIIHL